MDEEKCNAIFKAINILDNAFEQICGQQIISKEDDRFFSINTFFLQYNIFFFSPL